MRMPLRVITALIASLALSSAAAAAQDVKETAQVCAGCHGENGVPVDKTTPIIWGQNEGYLYLQLRDFKSGARKNDTMGAIVSSLEKDDMKALAAHFSRAQVARSAAAFGNRQRRKQGPDVGRFDWVHGLSSPTVSG